MLAGALRWILHVQLQGTSVPDTRQTVGTQLTQFQKHHKRQNHTESTFTLQVPTDPIYFFRVRTGWGLPSGTPVEIGSWYFSLYCPKSTESHSGRSWDAYALRPWRLDGLRRRMSHVSHPVRTRDELLEEEDRQSSLCHLGCFLSLLSLPLAFIIELARVMWLLWTSVGALDRSHQIIPLNCVYRGGPSGPNTCAVVGLISGVRHGQLIKDGGSKEPAVALLPPDPAGVPRQNLYRSPAKGPRGIYWKWLQLEAPSLISWLCGHELSSLGKFLSFLGFVNYKDWTRWALSISNILPGVTTCWYRL